MLLSAAWLGCLPPAARAQGDETAPPAPAAPAEAVAEPETAPPAPPGPTREALLQAELERAARDQPSTLLPWLVTGAGVAALLTGALVGALEVATCEGSCSSSGWWPWLAIGGCTVTTAGGIWVVLATRDEAEAQHRLERARRELERDRIDRGLPSAALGPSLRLRAAF